MSAADRPIEAGGDPLGDPLADPLADPRLDTVPEFIRNRIVEVADTVVAEGRRPTPPLIARVMKELRWEAVADRKSVV